MLWKSSHCRRLLNLPLPPLSLQQRRRRRRRTQTTIIIWRTWKRWTMFGTRWLDCYMLPLTKHTIFIGRWYNGFYLYRILGYKSNPFVYPIVCTLRKVFVNLSSLLQRHTKVKSTRSILCRCCHVHVDVEFPQALHSCVLHLCIACPNIPS